MPASDDDRQTPAPPTLAYEALRVTRRRLASGGADRIPLAATVAPPQPAIYTPPYFLRLTAPAHEVQSLAEILGEAHRLTLENQGLPIRQTEAYLTLSGRAAPVQVQLRDWAGRYLRHRAAHANPRDRGDPFEQFRRLWRECDQALGPLERTPGSLGYLFCAQVKAYAFATLFVATLAGRVRFVRRAADQPVDAQFNFRPLNRAAPRVIARAAQRFRLHTHFLATFVNRVVHALPPQGPAQFDRWADQEVARYLLALVADIQEMRPLLLRNFHTEKTAITIGPGALLHWDWCYRGGIGWILAAADQRDVFRFARQSRTASVATVDLAGELTDYHKPWVRLAPHVGGPRRWRANALTAHLLELCRDRLLAFYNAIDFDAVRRTARHADDWHDEQSQQALTLSCQELAQEQPDSNPDPDPDPEDNPPQPPDLATTTTRPHTPAAHRLPALRLRPLLTVLERRFGCEIAQGKGSEITVYRRGGHKFILNGHRRNPVVCSMLVRMLLQRVGIPPAEWHRAVTRHRP